MPRADFVCLSKKCQQPDGEAPTYELPVGATRCPICGSSRIRRLFNKVNVATGAAAVARESDKIIAPMMEQAARAPKGGTHGVNTLPLSGAQGASIMGRDQTGAAGFSRSAILPLIKSFQPPRPNIVRE